MAENESIKAWYAIRIKAIHAKASAHDLLRRHGVQFKNTGDREEQFSCPFHGKDTNPSARIYPESPNSPSHVWCFVCRERWDVIALWKKFYGADKKFHGLLRDIERYYGIVTPPVPEGAYETVVDDTDSQAFDHLYEACEDRLRSVRDDYVRVDDMKGYLLVGSILDKAFHQTNEGKLTFKEGVDLLSKLVIKIRERVQSASASQAPDS
jgi:hypothetical protein